jgi:tellurite resistance protein
MQAMIAVCIADGNVQDEEIEIIAKIYKQVFGYSLEVEWIKKTANTMLSNNFDIGEALDDKNEIIETSLKPLILKAACFVAAADKVIDEKERKCLAAIATGLGMTKQEMSTVFNKLQKTT